MMRRILYVLLILISTYSAFRSQGGFPYKIGVVDDNSNPIGSTPCEEKVKVVDERPVDCDFSGGYYFYPVYQEDFNHREDLSNNWNFNLGYTDDDSYDASDDGNTWMGGPIGPYNNNNIYTVDGKCHLEWKQEFQTRTPNGNVGPQFYSFTGAFLSSFFKLRQGVFEAKIKLPNNEYFFPAYWFMDHQEIDVFEFHDGDLNNNVCDMYASMNMNIHGYIPTSGGINSNRSGVHCNRNRKFPVIELDNNFFSDAHVYKLIWTDYRIEIYVDNVFVAYATKYYDGPNMQAGGCEHGAGGSGFPSEPRDCNYMSNAQGCNAYIGNTCMDYNKVQKDLTFPSTDHPMQFLISNKIVNGHVDDLVANWNTFSAVDKRIEVDWIKIYQPFFCGQSLTVLNESEFKNASGSTNFLTGYDINFANGTETAYYGAMYYNNAPTQNNSWHNFPTHVLATNQIAFLGETVFEEGTHLRAEIVPCSGGFEQFQRTSDQNSLSLSDDKGIFIKNDNPLIKHQKATRQSVLDNGAISVYPNPASNFINIEMDDADFYDLIEIKLIDALGKEKIVEKSKQIDISTLVDGFYNIRFGFSHGRFVLKKFVKMGKE